MKSGLNVNQGTNKMDAEILKDELDQAKAVLLKSQAQVKELRGALKFYANEDLYDVSISGSLDGGMNPISADADIFADCGERARKAIASTGHEQHQAELDDVSKVLAIISKSGCACPDCRVKVETDLESKRDALMKALEGVG